LVDAGHSQPLQLALAQFAEEPLDQVQPRGTSRHEVEVHPFVLRQPQTPVVRVTGKRFGCSMISAITNQVKVRVHDLRERFTSQMLSKFLRRPLRQNAGKVFLILDNHPVHRSKLVKQ
jgi:hypothetical protein